MLEIMAKAKKVVKKVVKRVVKKVVRSKIKVEPVAYKSHADFDPA